MTNRMIVAMNGQNIIGQSGSIPWSYPGDLKFFREKTLNQVVIMGRNTWESLPSSVRPLKDRVNLVVSSTLAPIPGVVYATLEEAIEAAEASWGDKDIWFIGGAKLYEAAMPLVSEVVITEIPDKVDTSKGKCVYWPGLSLDIGLDRKEKHPYCPELLVTYWTKSS